MIPESIQRYLQQHGIASQRHPHPRAVSAQQLAAALHVSGYRVAKSVVLRADGQVWLAVLSAPDSVDTERLAEVLGVRGVSLVDESEFPQLFPDCELGAEPPFGGLYGLPVVYDKSLSAAARLLFRAGSHEEALELSLEDFLRLESPRTGSFTQRAREQAEAASAQAPL